MIGFVSSGFNPPNSLTMEEIEFMDKCDNIIVDTFTSPFFLKNYKEKDLIFADREKLESYEWIFDLKGDTAIVISGDSFSATTHFNIYTDAYKRNIPVKVYHNATIVPAAGTRLGLHLYKIGPVVSLPRFSDKFHPLSPYEKIRRNIEMRLHTIVLLDISPPMTMKEAVDELLWMENELKYDIFTTKTKIGAISSLGMPNERIRFNSLDILIKDTELKPPITIVIPAELHFQEEENLSIFYF